MSKQRGLGTLAEEWERGPVQQALSRQKQRKEAFHTNSGIEVKPLYTPLDQEEIDFDYVRDLGFPGQYPFTRGASPLGHRQNLWIMLQYAGFGDAEQSNKRYRFLLERGVTGINVALDLPTQLGYDSDHPLAEGEVGKVGVPVCSLADMEAIFEGIPLDKPREISTPATAIGPIWLAMMLVIAEKQGVPPSNFVMRMGNDVLKEYYSRGTYIFPPKQAMSVTTDAIVYCSQHHPHWYPVTTVGYTIRETGANAAQELAFVIANTIAYIDDAISKGADPEKLSRFSVFLSCGMDFLEEVAKFRAMRRLWARTMRDRYDVSNESLLNFRLYTFTAGSSLTAQQPFNNVVRVAIESLAGVLGGTEVHNACSMDEAYCTPTERAVKVALRTQQIIAHETGVAQTIDPLAGSYCIESLTSKLETMAEEYIHKIEEMGGAVRGIENGYFRREIARSAYEINRQIEKGERVVVGVNQFIDEEANPIEILKVDRALEQKQKERLKTLKRDRNNAAVKQTLQAVRKAAENHENLVPSLIEAVRVYATVGEMCDALREVYGEYTAPSWT